MLEVLFRRRRVWLQALQGPVPLWVLVFGSVLGLHVKERPCCAGVRRCERPAAEEVLMGLPVRLLLGILTVQLLSEVPNRQSCIQNRLPFCLLAR